MALMKEDKAEEKDPRHERIGVRKKKKYEKEEMRLCS